jgi:hypothetical protein
MTTVAAPAAHAYFPQHHRITSTAVQGTAATAVVPTLQAFGAQLGLLIKVQSARDRVLLLLLLARAPRCLNIRCGA